MTEYEISGVKVSLKEVVENIEHWKGVLTEMTELVERAEAVVAGECMDSRFYGSETRKERLKRAKTYSAWYCLAEHYPGSTRCDIDNCMYDMCDHESYYKKTWYLKGVNQGIAICDWCWTEAKNLEHTIETLVGKN